ncbi:MAG: hypothetical protein HN337_06110 [Deltaproteobacteria bacterium]|jgi:hypothetical protein|nr:hypothetical protein [Deltaproteobacteria bacterium]
MRYKLLLLLINLGLVVGSVFYSQPADACGHEGPYAGIGYTQLLMYTPEHQLNPLSSRRITFGPGYGGHALFGYDFKGARWGIQMPFEIARLKLNKSEWVTYLGSTIEGVFHIKEWSNGFDFHVQGGIGWSYLTEGRDADQTKSWGITASAGPGFSYYFARTEKVSGALAVELPFRYIYYLGNHLSRNGTSVIALPIRISMQIGF